MLPGKDINSVIEKHPCNCIGLNNTDITDGSDISCYCKSKTIEAVRFSSTINGATTKARTTGVSNIKIITRSPEPRGNYYEPVSTTNNHAATIPTPRLLIFPK